MLSMFDVFPQRPICVRNTYFSNLPSYIMDHHNVIVPKEAYNVANESLINVLIIGI